jgi:tRNA(fMet)-specific endonuclease VapC
VNYFLDTNICVAAINGRPAVIAERIADKVARGDVVAISTIVLFELQYGVAKSKQVEKNARTLSTFLRPLLIVPFDVQDAHVAGELRSALGRRGEPIGPYDCLIAAQALRAEFVLVTANTKEFERVPSLRRENWIV